MVLITTKLICLDVLHVCSTALQNLSDASPVHVNLCTVGGGGGGGGGGYNQWFPTQYSSQIRHFLRTLTIL